MNLLTPNYNVCIFHFHALLAVPYGFHSFIKSIFFFVVVAKDHKNISFFNVYVTLSGYNLKKVDKFSEKIVLVVCENYMSRAYVTYEINFILNLAMIGNSYFPFIFVFC